MINTISKQEIEKILVEAKKNNTLDSVWVGEEYYTLEDDKWLEVDTKESGFMISDESVLWFDEPMNQIVRINLFDEINGGTVIQGMVSDILAVNSLEELDSKGIKYKSFLSIGNIYANEYLVSIKECIDDIGEFLEDAYGMDIIDESHLVEEEEAEESGFAYYSINGDLTQNIIIIKAQNL